VGRRRRLCESDSGTRLCEGFGLDLHLSLGDGRIQSLNNPVDGEVRQNQNDERCNSRSNNVGHVHLFGKDLLE
jgi:hypothetical protein